MRAVVWTGPDAAEIRDLPEPVAGDGHSVLAVRAAGVCGSDLHAFRGHSPVRVAPLVLGHELVAEDHTGSRYIVNPLVGCSACRLCASGMPNLCPRRGLLGLDRPGAFADRVAVPDENLIALPKGMSPLVGTLVEPLATPLNALDGAEVRGGVVAVLGCGPIGLLAAHAARVFGARLVAVQDPSGARLDHARDLADVVASDPEAVRAAVGDASAGLGADVVVDAAGVEASWRTAVALVRPGGLVAEIGLAQASGTAPIGDVVRRGVTLRGIYAYTPRHFAAAVEMLATTPPPVDWAQERALDDGPAVLAELARGQGPLKAVFTL